MISIYVINGPRSDQFFEIEGHTIFVGRTAENDFQINDYSVSRKHLKIARNANKYAIEDLGSSNGTFVSGVRVHENAILPGETIAIGPALLSIDEPADVRVDADASTGEMLPPPDDPDAFLIDPHQILDLTEALRQYRVMAEPMQPLCQPDCLGLCPRCGYNLNQGPCGCPRQQVDVRWAALGELAEKLEQE